MRIFNTSVGSSSFEGTLTRQDHGQYVDRGFVPLVVHALDGVRQISRLTKVLDGESVAYRQGEGDEGDPEDVEVFGNQDRLGVFVDAVALLSDT